jgi:hypothetical protein
VPTLTREHRTEGKPDPEALALAGPVVQVELSPIHLPDKIIRGPALIDTGTNVCAVDVVKARSANMSISGPASSMTTAVGSRDDVPVFGVRMHIPELTTSPRIIPRCHGANLQALGVIALIGRDFLAESVFTYNGARGRFSIRI